MPQDFALTTISWVYRNYKENWMKEPAKLRGLRSVLGGTPGEAPGVYLPDRYKCELWNHMIYYQLQKQPCICQ